MSQSYHANTSRRYLLTKGIGLEDLQQIWDKREIKRQTKAKRKPAPEPVDMSPLAGVPIEVIDDDPWMLYPVSIIEIRAVIDQIHDVNVAGLSQIGLCMGKVEQEHAAQERYVEDQVRDPVVGRIGLEWERGLYAPLIAGTYHPGTAKVRMYGYVITEDFVSDPQVILELKSMFLHTLLHEIIHHRQERTVLERGRLETARTDRYEGDAEVMTTKWFQEYALPVLAAGADNF